MQVFQRSGATGTVAFAGTKDGSFTSIQAMATATNGGSDVGWTTIYTGSASPWTGTLALVPGQYTITLRALNSGVASNSMAIDKIGVGELFIVAGQSLVANYGNSTNTPSDSRVYTATTAGVWRFATDPQPATDGTGGTPLPALGSALASYLGMPVGFLDIAVGGTSTTDWINTYYASKLAPAITQLGLFRAILWENGQTDAINGISAATYESNLATMITNSRTLAGFTVPWGVADHSTVDNNNPSTIIQGAQDFVVANNTSTFAGSNTDSISNTHRYDGTHLDATGQSTQGTQWATAIKTFFGW